MATQLRAVLETLAPKDERAQWGAVATTSFGKPWAESGLYQAFERAQQRANLEGWTFHDLRHFFVTELFRRGAPAPAVQLLAGHADLSTTQRYADMAASDLQRGNCAIRRALHPKPGNAIVIAMAQPKWPTTEPLPEPLQSLVDTLRSLSKDERDLVIQVAQARSKVKPVDPRVLLDAAGIVRLGGNAVEDSKALYEALPRSLGQMADEALADLAAGRTTEIDPSKM
jgi:hypothetical protein